jgi:glycosyltransferase involved in cell wall biosynthesis
MKVWIFQTGEPLQVDPIGLRPMRAMNLSNTLIEQGHEVVLWSSNFDHFSKTHRFKREREIQYSKNLKIKLIPSCGYNSNVGISRLIDHIALALNLKRMLKTQIPPDVAFIGYPPIEAPWIIARWLKKHNVPFLIDVKDAWPEIFVRKFPGKYQRIIKIMFFPQLIMMKNVFQMADGISAPTQDFLDWCLQKLPREQNSFDRVTPITSPDSIISREELKKAENWLDDLNIKNSGVFRICYIGSITKSLNFSPIIKAAEYLPIEFVIAGNGIAYETTINQCKHLSNIRFLGWIDRAQINRLYARSNLMIAPYVNSFDFQLNITNKFYDAMSNGKPFITCLSGAITKIMNKYNIGITYDGDQISNLSEVLATIINDKNSLIKLGNNAQNLYQRQYTSKKVYSELVRDLIELCNYDS